jgi:hypothetical protein
MEEVKRRSSGCSLLSATSTYTSRCAVPRPTNVTRSARCLMTYVSSRKGIVRPRVDLELESISWAVTEYWLLELPRELPLPRLEMKPEEERFWPTYVWSNNPWIVDREGEVLSPAKYAKIKVCTLHELHIKRTGATTYSMKIPTIGIAGHQQAKLRRWALAILLNAPHLAIGEYLAVSREITFRHQMQLEQDYHWKVTATGTVIGSAKHPQGGQPDEIELEQQGNGVYWQVCTNMGNEDDTMVGDRKRLQQNQSNGSIVFNAHPLCHGIPWSVPDNIANKHVGAVLKKQPFQRLHREIVQLDKVLDGLQQATQVSQWQAAAMDQTPTQLWAHRNELTAYQVWVAYRVAVRQLNLYHEGRKVDNSCRKLSECKGSKETLEHIFWDCRCAQACWGLLITQWTEETVAVGETAERSTFRNNCASRKAPPLSATTKKRIQETHPDEVKQYQEEWKRLWRILTSICLTSLWTQRNRVIFQQEEVTAESSAQEYWTTAMRQLRAVAKRERSKPDKQIQGIRLSLCQQALDDRSREHSPRVMSPVQPPDLNKAPALLTRLRKYQTSSRQ